MCVVLCVCVCVCVSAMSEFLCERVLCAHFHKNEVIDF